jgi:hypothetical protein
MAQTVNMQPRMSRQAVPQAITKLSFTFHHRVGKGFFSDDFTIGLAQSKLRQWDDSSVTMMTTFTQVSESHKKGVR